MADAARALSSRHARPWPREEPDGLRRLHRDRRRSRRPGSRFRHFLVAPHQASERGVEERSGDRRGYYEHRQREPRLSLSIKDLEPNAWEKFTTEHKPGDVVHGKVARFANFGAFIELDDNLEGLCHISELSEERIAKPEDVVQLGQEMDFKILRIDPDTKKIGLSARAVGKDEPIVDTKIYSSEAGGAWPHWANLPISV